LEPTWTPHSGPTLSLLRRNGTEVKPASPERAKCVESLERIDEGRPTHARGALAEAVEVALAVTVWNNKEGFKSPSL